MRLGRRRGDNAELAIIEFIDYQPAKHEAVAETKEKPSLMDRAKGMFGGGAKADKGETAEADEADEGTPEEAEEAKAPKG
jgi:hypothetical protein